MPRRLAWVVNLGCIDLNPHPVRADDLDHPDELRIDLDPMPGRRLDARSSTSPWSPGGAQRPRARRLAEDVWLAGFPHLRAHRPRWDFRRCGTPPRRSPARSRSGRRARDRALVEGGARRERVRRLQPERQGSHGRIRLLGAAAPDARVSTPLTGTRCATAVPSGSPCRPCSSGSPSSATLSRASTRRSADSTGCWHSPSELGPAEKPPRGAAREGSGRRQSIMPLIEIAGRDQAGGARGSRALEGAPCRGRRPAAAGRRALDGMRGAARSGTASA